MRSLWALCAVFPTVFACGEGQAAVIGAPVLRDGVEIAPSTAIGMALDHAPIGQAADAVFLVADIHAAKGEAHGFGEHAFIPYLSVSYALTKDDAPTFKKAGLLVPVAAKSGPRYAASADMAGAGTYHLTYIVSPPSAHGMLRQTDKTDGVPDWWKPITASWTFTYPSSDK